MKAEKGEASSPPNADALLDTPEKRAEFLQELHSVIPPLVAARAEGEMPDEVEDCLALLSAVQSATLFAGKDSAEMRRVCADWQRLIERPKRKRKATDHLGSHAMGNEAKDDEQTRRKERRAAQQRQSEQREKKKRAKEALRRKRDEEKIEKEKRRSSEMHDAMSTMECAEFDIMFETGKLGLNLIWNDAGFVYVASVVAGTQAQYTPVRKSDTLVSINGARTAGKRFESIIEELVDAGPRRRLGFRRILLKGAMLQQPGAGQVRAGRGRAKKKKGDEADDGTPSTGTTKQFVPKAGKPKTTAKSLFTGVTQHGSKFESYVKVNDRSHFLGRFGSEMEAARRHDEAARVLYGEETVPPSLLNFPNGEPAAPVHADADCNAIDTQAMARHLAMAKTQLQEVQAQVQAQAQALAQAQAQAQAAQSQLTASTVLDASTLGEVRQLRHLHFLYSLWQRHPRLERDVQIVHNF